jgi:hypothetical protein
MVVANGGHFIVLQDDEKVDRHPIMHTIKVSVSKC